MFFKICYVFFTFPFAFCVSKIIDLCYGRGQGTIFSLQRVVVVLNIHTLPNQT